MKKQSQKGSSPLVVILLVLTAGIVGFVGWYVYNENNNTKVSDSSDVKTASQTTTPTTMSAPDIPADWKSYTATSGNVSFKYPANWYVIAPYDGNVQISSVAETKKAGTNGNVERPEYDDNLYIDLTYSVGKSTQENNYATNADLLQSDFPINNSGSCLIGHRNSAVEGNPVTFITVNACKPNDKSSMTKQIASDTGYFDILITSAGNGSFNGVPIQSDNSDLATIKLILQTIRF